MSYQKPDKLEFSPQLKEHTTKMALTFYVADVENTFKNLDNDTMMKLVKEISALSLVMPIFLNESEYAQNNVKKVLEMIPQRNDNKPSGYLSATPDNKVTITVNNQIIKKDVSPLYLMAVYVYCFDKISGKQLSEGNLGGQFGFDYLKMGLKLNEVKQNGRFDKKAFD